MIIAKPHSLSLNQLLDIFLEPKKFDCNKNLGLARLVSAQVVSKVPSFGEESICICSHVFGI